MKVKGDDKQRVLTKDEIAHLKGEVSEALAGAKPNKRNPPKKDSLGLSRKAIAGVAARRFVDSCATAASPVVKKAPKAKTRKTASKSKAKGKRGAAMKKAQGVNHSNHSSGDQCSIIQSHDGLSN